MPLTTSRVGSPPVWESMVWITCLVLMRHLLSLIGSRDPVDPDREIEDDDDDDRHVDRRGRDGGDHGVDGILDVVEELDGDRHELSGRVEHAELDVDPGDDDREE